MSGGAHWTAGVPGLWTDLPDGWRIEGFSDEGHVLVLDTFRAEYGVGCARLRNQMGGYGDARARELTRSLSRCLARGIP